MEPIQIVTISSDEFAKHLAVMLYSLLKNKVSTQEIVINIIDSDISEENKIKLTQLVEKFNGEIKFLNISDKKSLFDGFKLHHHFTKETFFRIIAPELLDSSIEKAIILDGDLIFEQDVTELWNTDLGSYLVGAVEELYGKYVEHLYIPEDAIYFNAGVLLVNVKKWRENDISSTVLKFMRDNDKKIFWLDQDGLNAILTDKCLPLDIKWNYCSHHHYANILIEKPAIIHYNSDIKPWNEYHIMGEYYLKYKQELDW
ncbi:glycosyltransferase family 8 protein [Neobacillus sp. Marseille-QA0830]